MHLLEPATAAPCPYADGRPHDGQPGQAMPCLLLLSAVGLQAKRASQRNGQSLVHNTAAATRPCNSVPCTCDQTANTVPLLLRGPQEGTTHRQPRCCLLPKRASAPTSSSHLEELVEQAGCDCPRWVHGGSCKVTATRRGSCNGTEPNGERGAQQGTRHRAAMPPHPVHSKKLGRAQTAGVLLRQAALLRWWWRRQGGGNRSCCRRPQPHRADAATDCQCVLQQPGRPGQRALTGLAVGATGRAGRGAAASTAAIEMLRRIDQRCCGPPPSSALLTAGGRRRCSGCSPAASCEA